MNSNRRQFLLRSAGWAGGLGALAFSRGSGAAVPEGFRLEGDRYRFERDGLRFSGILLRPEGPGPFPGLLVSHGLGGNAERFGRSQGRQYVARGYLVVAPDYTHSIPAGDRKSFGASEENLNRARRCLDLLHSLPETDRKRTYAYGNSMGAFLTIGLAAAEPERLAAAAITAGGIVPAAGFPAPSREQAARIKTPFLMLHGTRDTTVPPERSALLEEVLKAGSVPHERHLFEGEGHNLHAAHGKEIADRIDAWFRKYPAG